MTLRLFLQECVWCHQQPSVYSRANIFLCMCGNNFSKDSSGKLGHRNALQLVTYPVPPRPLHIAAILSPQLLCLPPCCPCCTPKFPRPCVRSQEPRTCSALLASRYGSFCPPDPGAGVRMEGHPLPKAHQGHTGASNQEPGPDPVPYVVPKQA